MKGLPTFLSDLVVKRYPLAIHYLRTQMMVHKEKRTRTQSEVSSECEEEELLLFNSMDLPDDFIPESTGDSKEEQHYEQTVPIECFIRNDR